MFRRFEKVLNPTDEPERPEPPPGLLAFYWHFARQVTGLLAALFVIELFVALLDTAVPWFMGRIVTFVSKVPPERFLDETWPWLVGMAATVLVARPGIVLARYLVMNQAIAGPFTNLIRWQSHWHVVRQSWAFFQNDFAGRISNRVMQTGPALRESLVASFTAVWYVIVYGTSAVVMSAAADWWLAIPIVLWFAGYVALLLVFVPRMRDRSKVTSEARSALMGRIVDSYTNILTLKLFARPRDEDAYVRAAERDAGRGRGRARARAMARWRGRSRRHRDGAAAHFPAHQHVALDRLLGHRDIRGDRRGAGRDADDRPAVAAHRPFRRRASRRRQRPDRLRRRAFRLRPRDRRPRRLHAHRASGREDRPRRPLRRRQVDGDQSAAALLRPGGRAHPDRRPGHLALHPGIAARADLGRHPGHLAPAPLDPRQHPLRPSRRRRGRGDRRGQARPRGRVRRRARGLEGPARLRRPCRRARREALRRAAPARRNRPRDPERCADPGARRGDLGARQ